MYCILNERNGIIIPLKPKKTPKKNVSMRKMGSIKNLLKSSIRELNKLTYYIMLIYNRKKTKIDKINFST